MSVNEYEQVDLSRMKEYPRCAVICRTEEEVRSFYHNCTQQLSELMHWNIRDIISLWEIYRGRTGFTLCYADRDKLRDMSYCYEQWFRANGYEIVEFSELSNHTELEESEMPIESIFGLN